MSEMIEAVSELHRTALGYARDGIPIFVCVPGTKVPATANGFKDATTDETIINAWFGDNPNYNVALEPAKGGWAVVDVDPDGIEWAASVDLPDTYTVQTPRGGYHAYYKGTLRPTASKLARGVDTRGENSYVL